MKNELAKKEENLFPWKKEKEFLTNREQAVADFYEENPGCSKLDCAKKIYGISNYFNLQNLSSIECNLRKKGYLFYTIGGKIIDMANPDANVEEKLKVQRRVGRRMIGNLEAGIRIMQVAVHKEQFDLVKEQIRESVKILVDNKVIDLSALKSFKVVPVRKLIK